MDDLSTGDVAEVTHTHSGATELMIPIEGVLYSAQVPPPISTNNLYFNVSWTLGRKTTHSRKKSKPYVDWLTLAGETLMAQGRRPQLTGLVVVRLELGEGACSAQIDTDNCAKAYLDLLVINGIIKDDTRRIVRALVIHWVPGDRCGVSIYRWGGAP